MKALSCAILAAALFSAAHAADAGLYLYPRAERGGASLITIADIAKIESDPRTASLVGAIVIDEAFYGDGYLDRSEIARAVGDAGGRLTIYGSGVRVAPAGGAAAPAGEPRSIVKSGSPVRFQVVNARIRVERMGTAMRDGAAGDVIPVKLKGSAVLRGVILDERTVELKL